MPLMIWAPLFGMEKSVQFPMTKLKELMREPSLRLSTLPPVVAETIQLQVFARQKLSRHQVIGLLRDRLTYFGSIPRDINQFVIYPMVFGKPNTTLTFTPITRLLSDDRTYFRALPDALKTLLQPFMERVATDDDLAPILTPFNGSKELCLFSAVERSDAKLVQLLIASKVNINHEREYETPLWIAVKRRDRDIAHILLANGADPNALMSRELPVMVCNLRTNHPHVAGILLKKGAQEVYAPAYDNRPLSQAVRLLDPFMVELLLENGTALDTVTYPAEPAVKQDHGFGATALCVAAGNRDPETVRLLLAAGADALKPNAFGQRPLDIALKEGPQETVDALKAYIDGRTSPEPIGKFIEKLWQSN